MYNTSIFTGKLFLILGPSGSGKGTTIKYLKKKYPNYTYPVSHTTRKARENEKNGENYHFISKNEFKSKIKNKEFLEWALVHQDNYYGTDKQEILDSLQNGEVIIREVDVQGAENIKKIIPSKNLIRVFISTKSWEDLKERIILRSNISKEEVEKRYQSFLKESEYATECEYQIYTENGNPDHSNNLIEKIIEKEVRITL